MYNIYLTGDTHGDMNRVINFANKINASENDIFIILGDVGLNYYGNYRDINLKKQISNIKATLFCIHGNHEMNPEYMKSMKTKEYFNGIVFYEENFPNILYAKDGEIYNINDKSFIVLGGAYSVDKFIRLEMGAKWFQDEQMSNDVKDRCIENIKSNNWKIDYVLSHTTPYNYMPIDMFLSSIDQSKVDKSMENWLQYIEDNLTYKHWYAGHYHCERTTNNLTIMFTNWILLE